MISTQDTILKYLVNNITHGTIKKINAEEWIEKARKINATPATENSIHPL